MVKKKELINKNINKNISKIFFGIVLSVGAFSLAQPQDVVMRDNVRDNTSNSAEKGELTIESLVVAVPEMQQEPIALPASAPISQLAVEANTALPVAPASESAPVAAPVSQDQMFPELVELQFVAENKILMEYLYQGVTGFVKLSDQERACIEHGFAKSAVYGEIPYPSLQVILDNELIGPNDVFYDLGCGVGKVVTQVFLNTPVRKAVGIELSVSRYTGAQAMMRKFKNTDAYIERKYNAKSRRTISFIQQDFLKANINDATIIYMCATCFAPELMQKLVEKFAKINRIGLRVITLKKLPDHEKHGFRFDRGYKLPMSWSKAGKKSSVFVYTYVGNLLK